ncbi:MAG: DivIVA domain-containing protein [Ignavibacteriales bacterium]|nr:DivIVA domain-containing protein [Ignavibacteriales bacterium]
MKITPLEIKRQQFKKVMRGYDSVEVDTFLDMLSNEVEDLLRLNKEMKDKLIGLETQLVDYKNMEKTLQQTLLQAQETSGRSIENSRKEADLIIKEAELKASQIVEKARLDFARAKEEISTLKARKESMLSKLRVLLSSELDLIRALDIDEDNVLRGDRSQGTGKDQIEIDDILKKL